MPVDVIEAVLSEALEHPVFGEDEFARRHRVLPLHPDWYGTTYLTTSGEFWYRNSEADPVRIECGLNESSKTIALVLATESHPDLRVLLPPRPADAIDCESCEGRGQITVGTVSNIICGQCSALGWQSTAPSREGFYPTFEAALERLRKFVVRFGHPSHFAFGSPTPSVAAAKRAYAQAVARRLGVVLEAVSAQPDGRLGISVYGPQTEPEAMRMMAPNGLKLIAPERPT